jgi:glucose-6-phosphate isomerase
MISIDLRNTGTDRLGPVTGVDLPRELAAWSRKLSEFTSRLLAGRSAEGGMLGWIDLPGQTAEAEAISTWATSVAGRYSDLVVLGIGGSSLGALAVITALQHPGRNLQATGSGLRVHFVDNVDPDQISGLLDVLDPLSTLVNVISKSGTTAETMAAYLLFRHWIEEGAGENYREQIIATTDSETGILRPLAEAEGYRIFSVPASVGGRFSVLSPVGLVPIALAGIDIQELLRGAAWTNALIEAPLPENPVAQAALVQYLSYRRGRHISVLMPYSSRLRFLSDWFVQLWAESLGKAENRDGSIVHEGSTPLGALGATDQHSQVQLFNEGPADKIITFIRLGKFDAELLIPAPQPAIPELAYLAGESFNRLINAEQAATAHALREHGRPSYTLTLPELSAGTLGALLQFLMWQTALMGELTFVDAYDQPGVELAKVYTYALLGREGFERQRDELAEAGVE